MSEQGLKLISAREVALALGVPISWVYEQTRKGKLRHYKLGKYRRYKLDEILEDLKRDKTTLE